MIYIGGDHAGFKLKERVKAYFKKKGIKFKDEGNVVLDVSDDYPDFGYKVAKKVKGNKKGILFCGSSFGVCIVANKVKGIRAVSVSNEREAELSRLHNDANILCLPGWGMSFGKAKRIIDVWLKTEFSNEDRHVRRLNKIKKIDK